MARDPVSGPPSAGDRLFWRLVALATTTHFIARPPGVGGVPDLDERLTGWLAVATAVAVLWRPGTRWTRVAHLLAIIASFVAETPVAANHWALGALTALVLLVDGGARTGRPTAGPVAVLVVAYGFAVFAKLNTAFLDPSASCAVVLANSGLGLVGWSLDPAGTAAAIVPWLAVGIEATVFGLLVIPRTRRWGAVIGMGFHLLLVIDLANRFYDFTGVLMPLFLLAAGTGEAAAAELRRLPARLRRAGPAGAVVVGSVALLAVESPGPAFVVGRAAVVVGWFILMVVVVVASARALAGDRTAPRRPLPAVALVVVALTLVNGLTPYLEVKTTFGFNMFSNLRTEAGETNHVLLPATRPSPRFDDLVEVLDSSDETLARYVDSGFLLPLESLRSYTAGRPDVGLVYRLGAEVVDADPRPPESPLDEPVPWLRARFGYHRAVDEQVPKRCEVGFLPLT